MNRSATKFPVRDPFFQVIELDFRCHSCSGSSGVERIHLTAQEKSHCIRSAWSTEAMCNRSRGVVSYSPQLPRTASLYQDFWSIEAMCSKKLKPISLESNARDKTNTT